MRGNHSCSGCVEAGAGGVAMMSHAALLDVQAVGWIKGHLSLEEIAALRAASTRCTGQVLPITGCRTGAEIGKVLRNLRLWGLCTNTANPLITQRGRLVLVGNGVRE